MKRFFIVMSFMIVTTTFAQAPNNYLREDFKELSRALAELTRSVVEQIAIIRVRIDVLEKQVGENKDLIRGNTSYIDRITGKEGVTGSAWNYFFVFIVAIGSSLMTTLLIKSLNNRNRNSRMGMEKVDWKNDKKK
jgi:hypothetical protein